MLAYMLDYLDKHYGENINLNLVADKLNLSPGYLSTFFKEKQGINFSDYLNNLRISHAKELLMNVDLRIQEIALQVGYLNVNSFIRMFKRASGLTPGEYRKSHASGGLPAGKTSLEAVRFLRLDGSYTRKWKRLCRPFKDGTVSARE